MEGDTRQYQLEPLEQRLLLSASGLIDDAVAAVDQPTQIEVVVPGYVAEEQTSSTQQTIPSYHPEAELDDLFGGEIEAVSPSQGPTGDSDQDVELDELFSTPTVNTDEEPAGLERTDPEEARAEEPSPAAPFSGDTVTAQRIETLNAARFLEPD